MTWLLNLAEQDLCVPNYIRDYGAAGSLMS
jgi:hypothetical protein